jgi:hypothetical protein
VGWIDEDDADITLRIFNETGAMIRGEIAVPLSAGTRPEPSSPFAIAPVAGGGFRVAVSAEIIGTGSVTLIWREYNASGQLTSDWELADPSSPLVQGFPNATDLGGGRTLLTWFDGIKLITAENPIETIEGNIKATIIEADGSTITGTFLVNNLNFGFGVTSTAVALSSNRFVVVWDDIGIGGDTIDGFGIKAQLFNGNGTKIDTDFTVNTITGNNQNSPDVALLDNGNFVVVWQDSSFANGQDSRWDIRAQVFNANGGRVGSEFTVNPLTPGNQVAPKVAAFDSGQFLVTWTDESGFIDDPSTAVVGRLFTNDGLLATEAFLVNTTVAGTQDDQSIAASGDTAIVAWSDDNNSPLSPDGTDIKAQALFRDDDLGARYFAGIEGAPFDKAIDFAPLVEGGIVGAYLTQANEIFINQLDLVEFHQLAEGESASLDFAGQLSFAATDLTVRSLSDGRLLGFARTGTGEIKFVSIEKSATTGRYELLPTVYTLPNSSTTFDTDNAQLAIRGPVDTSFDVLFAQEYTEGELELLRGFWPNGEFSSNFITTAAYVSLGIEDTSTATFFKQHETIGAIISNEWVSETTLPRYDPPALYYREVVYSRTESNGRGTFSTVPLEPITIFPSANAGNPGFNYHYKSNDLIDIGGGRVAAAVTFRSTMEIYVIDRTLATASQIIQLGGLGVPLQPGFDVKLIPFDAQELGVIWTKRGGGFGDELVMQKYTLSGIAIGLPVTLQYGLATDAELEVLPLGDGRFAVEFLDASGTRILQEIDTRPGLPLFPDATNDFNGEGTSDILWFNAVTGGVGQFEMNNGSPTWQLIGTSGANWEIAGTGDFDGDGTDDILWFNPATGGVGQFEMNNGSPTWRNISTSGANWEAAGTGDFNGDGTDDILWFNTATGGVGQFEMNNGSSTWRDIGTSSAIWEIAGTGDFNGDGTDDILWFNTVTGDVGQFEMNNGSATWQLIGTGGGDWGIIG